MSNVIVCDSRLEHSHKEAYDPRETELDKLTES